MMHNQQAGVRKKRGAWVPDPLEITLFLSGAIGLVPIGRSLGPAGRWCDIRSVVSILISVCCAAAISTVFLGKFGASIVAGSATVLMISQVFYQYSFILGSAVITLIMWSKSSSFIRLVRRINEGPNLPRLMMEGNENFDLGYKRKISLWLKCLLTTTPALIQATFYNAMYLLFLQEHQPLPALQVLFAISLVWAHLAIATPPVFQLILTNRVVDHFLHLKACLAEALTLAAIEETASKGDQTQHGEKGLTEIKIPQDVVNDGSAFSKTRSFQSRFLTTFLENHQELRGMAENLFSILGPSLLFAHIQIFLAIVSATFSVLYHLQNLRQQSYLLLALSLQFTGSFLALYCTGDAADQLKEQVAAHMPVLANYIHHRSLSQPSQDATLVAAITGREIESSVCGLYSISRSNVPTVLEIVVSYLVVLMQMRSNDGD